MNPPPLMFRQRWPFGIRDCSSETAGIKFGNMDFTNWPPVSGQMVSWNISNTVINEDINEGYYY